ncbi:MAG TPA: Zn-dependent hydrolase, partial [Rubrobacter sp.]|nr:Zn-dependent hydrolase [Rubrobacter sp.]
MVDGERLWRRISELGEIGRHESGGVTRLSLTDEERAAKDMVADYMEEAGLSVREDAAGNLFGRREGRDPDAPAVIVGSHVDSVYEGGNFDGPLGVLSGIEIVQTMEERGIETEHPVEVVAFTDEEGARFSFGMIGSRALAGSLSTEDLSHEDENGVTIADAMRDYGLDPERVLDAARPAGSVAAYVELHIEQGRVLENEGLPVGVVTGIAAPVWRKFVFTGETGHAGTTPMGHRSDALAAAAEVMAVIEAEASATGSSVGTVGQLGVEPGGINIIPGRVELSLDLRDIDEETRDLVEGRILQRTREVCEKR